MGRTDANAEPPKELEVATFGSEPGLRGDTVSQRSSLRELAWLFLKLGTIAFGGPASHIAMMEDEVVRRRRWITREEFLDLLGATNLIPGPNSTELAIHIGHRRAGWTGLIVAGTSFIVPAALIVSAFGWVYVRYGSLPQTGAILYGVKPVIIAVILQALWRLGAAAMKTKPLVIVAAAGVVTTLLGANELLVLFAAGAVMAVGRLFIASDVRTSKEKPARKRTVFSIPPAVITQAAVGGTISASFGLWPLFLFFLKVGSVLFGSGYVLLVFLRADLVERWHWLTESQLLDAIAVGQVTPGPVFTTATFIGYILGGPRAAAIATLGIFLPAFVFVAASGPLIPRLRRSRVAGAFLDGVNAASLSLMVVVSYQLGRSALIDVMTISLFMVSMILLIRFRINSAWLVLGGALVGLVTALWR